jgi:hypothetical protein
MLNVSESIPSNGIRENIPPGRLYVCNGIAPEPNGGDSANEYTDVPTFTALTNGRIN